MPLKIAMPFKSKEGCCSCNFPDIPARWLLFIDFAFIFATTVVFFADIVTDIITLEIYWEKEWYYAFGLSLFFIVAPSILVAVLEYNFIKKTYGKNVSWKTWMLRTVLNVPFQLTVIWYHCQLTYTYFKSWMDSVRGIETKGNATSTAQWYEPTTLERSRGASLSSLNELDRHSNVISQKRTELNESSGLANNSENWGSPPTIEEEKLVKKKSNWWKRLTREQWLYHINNLKLSESMLESLPQLLLNLYLIIRDPSHNAATIQYISAVLSYLSLCGGVVRYDKTKKDNEADRWMADMTLLHSRAFYTRLEWPQLLFITIYKGSFLAARSLAFVYFAIYLSWYILIPLLLHWSVLLIYLVYKWYPDFSKVTRLSQADNKYRAYVFLSRDFMSVLLESLIGIFIHMRSYFHSLLDQSYCFMFWYYLAYVIENITLFTVPGIVNAANDAQLELYRYYPLFVTDLILNLIGALFCAVYYVAVHKTRTYTAHAYPFGSKALCFFCIYSHKPEDESMYWLPVREEWTVCKQVETSELFFLTKDQLQTFQQTYNTVVRKDRQKGRGIECFIDDRCQIFYAPRSQLEKINMKMPDEATLRPSYRKLKKAHERSLAANPEINESPTGARNKSNKSKKKALHRSDSDAGFPTQSISVDVYPEDDLNPVDNMKEPPARPVRKPRVKSLRSTNPTSIPLCAVETDEISLLVEQEANLASPKSAPIPLPRKASQKITNNERLEHPFTSDFEISSDRSSSHRSKKSGRRADEQHPPRRTDDPAQSSSKYAHEFDDSTYRVPKSDKQNSKSRLARTIVAERSDEDSCPVQDADFNPKSQVVFTSTGSAQTYI